MPTIKIWSAGPDDAELVASLILELAVYEKLEHEAAPDVAALREQLDETANPRLYCLIASLDGEPVGFAIYFFRYTTFLTNWGVHLEDIYVSDKARGLGVGTQLLGALAQFAVQHSSKRLDLNVLVWNEGASKLYRRLGGMELDGWKMIRFDERALLLLTT